MTYDQANIYSDLKAYSGHILLKIQFSTLWKWVQIQSESVWLLLQHDRRYYTSGPGQVISVPCRISSLSHLLRPREHFKRGVKIVRLSGSGYVQRNSIRLA